MFKRAVRNPIAWLGLVAVVLVLMLVFTRPTNSSSQRLMLSEYENALRGGQVKTASIDDSRAEVTGTLDDGKAYVVSYPHDYVGTLTTELLNNVQQVGTDRKHASFLYSILVPLIPFVLVFGIFLVLLNSFWRRRQQDHAVR